MDTEFHFYGIYYLASEAGFHSDDALVLAYSSQYVDHSLVPLRIEFDDHIYATEVTQQYRFWDKNQERRVWIPFHFFPGDAARGAARRTDGAENPFVVTPHSERVKRFLVSALEARNLYRVGIALHTYADSWAHQDFTGRWEDFNVVDPQSTLPAIGHAQVTGKPDDYDSTWEDPRLKPEFRLVDNRARTLAAARMIYRYLCTYNRRNFADEELVVERLSDIYGKPGEKSAEERRLDLVIETGAPEYDRLAWRAEAATLPKNFLSETNESIAEKVGWVREELRQTAKVIAPRVVPGRPGFPESHLYRWNEAVREQRRAAYAILDDLLSTDVPRSAG